MLFGCYAVMASDNQAGTALVLLAGAVLVLLGLQGTPLRRLGSGEHSLELAALRRRQIAIEVVAEATREQPPDIAAAVAEAVEAIEPIGSSPRYLGMRYELLVKQAIERVGGQVPFMNHYTGPDLGIDMTAYMPSGAVHVQAKYRSKGVISRRDIDALNQRISRAPRGGFLIVTNAPLSESLKEYNNYVEEDPLSAKVITWSGPADDDILAAALRRSSR